MTYSFIASNPGTFLYQSGTNPEKQARMGLAGALIVRPSMGANFGYNRADSQFTPQEEVLAFLSEIDPYQHMATEQNKPFDLTTYHVHYWLLNGRTFPIPSPITTPAGCPASPTALWRASIPMMLQRTPIQDWRITSMRVQKSTRSIPMAITVL